MKCGCTVVDCMLYTNIFIERKKINGSEWNYIFKRNFVFTIEKYDRIMYYNKNNVFILLELLTLLRLIFKIFYKLCK